MATGNSWQVVLSSNPNEGSSKAGESKLRRTRSWTVISKKSPRSSVGEAELKGKLKRTLSLKLKDRARGKLQPSFTLGGGTEKKNWKGKTLWKATKKGGGALLKKAGQHAEKLLDAGDMESGSSADDDPTSSPVAERARVGSVPRKIGLQAIHHGPRRVSDGSQRKLTPSPVKPPPKTQSTPQFSITSESLQLPKVLGPAIKTDEEEFFDCQSNIYATPDGASLISARGNGGLGRPSLASVQISPRASKTLFAKSQTSPEKKSSTIDHPRPVAIDVSHPLQEEEPVDPEKVYVYDPNCPVHGVHKRKRKKKEKSDSVSLEREQILNVDNLSEGGYSMNSEMDYRTILASQAYGAKVARKRKRAAMTPAQRERTNKELSKIRSNLFTISVAFLFLFTAFHGLQNLQSTVHGRDRPEIGPISLAVVYFGISGSSLLVPPYVLNRLGCKLSLIVCVCIYALYMLSHFRPVWYSLLPSSLLLGFAAATLWTAKSTYLTQLGFHYARLNVEAPNVVIVRFFGYFFMIHHLGQVFGNLISSSILTLTSDPVELNRTIERASDQKKENDEVNTKCGHFFTQLHNLSVGESDDYQTKLAKQNLESPSQRGYLAVCAAYFCCCLVSALILSFFLNTLKKDTEASREKPWFQLQVWKKTVEGLAKPKHLLLIPLTIFNGMEQAFIAAEFTKAYVGCCLGISSIGYVMASFGLTDALCSFVFGPLIRLFGRMPLFMFAAVVNMLMIFTLLAWPPNHLDTTLFYVIATAWGMADGVWNTQINGLWVVLFSSNLEVAFANYRLWESIGFTFAFILTTFLPTKSILVVLLSVLLVGMLGYGLIELWDSLTVYFTHLLYAWRGLYRIYINKKGTSTLHAP